MVVGALDFVVVALVLYIFECIRQIRVNELVLDWGLGKAHHLKKPVLYPSDRWGWTILNPLRPFGPVFCLQSAPYAFTKRGVLVDMRSPGTTTFYQYEKCQDPSFESDAQRQFTTMLSRLAAARESDRAERIRSYEQNRFDIEGIRRDCADMRLRAVPLRRIAVTQSILCFAVFPVSLFALTLKLSLIFFTPAVWLLCILSAITYKRSSVESMSDHSKMDLYGDMVKLIFYPISTLRSLDLLSWDLLSVYDPIAVVTALCGKEEATELAVKEVIGLRYRAASADVDEGTLEAIQEYRERRLRLLERFSAQQGFVLSGAGGAPDRMDAGCRTFCPQCGAQYTFSSGVCADCRDIVLQPFSSYQSRHGTETGRSHGR